MKIQNRRKLIELHCKHILEKNLYFENVFRIRSQKQVMTQTINYIFFEDSMKLMM
jgi:hypothetical protein